MTTCNIIGGGGIDNIPINNSFVIGTNFYASYANIIVAVDEPTVDKLLRDNIDGFTHQLVFTTPRVYERFYNHHRCFSFDYSTYYNINSLSSGLTAIALANVLNFSNILLHGFDLLTNKHKGKFRDLQHADKKYRIIKGNNYGS